MTNDLTPRELHKIDLVYKISEKRQLTDENGNILLDYTNTELLDKCPHLGFLCYKRLNEKYSVLKNRCCVSIMQYFDSILGRIIEYDDKGKVEELWRKMKKEPDSFIYNWYFGELDDIYVEDVNQDLMYDYIRKYRVLKTERDKATKPKKTNDGITIQEKCEKAQVNYRKVLRYRHFHPDMTEDEVIDYYVKKDKSKGV